MLKSLMAQETAESRNDLLFPRLFYLKFFPLLQYLLLVGSKSQLRIRIKFECVTVRRGSRIKIHTNSYAPLVFAFHVYFNFVQSAIILFRHLASLLLLKEFLQTQTTVLK
jgi:predicted CDP-diglyceride synthetase/phosphatidate cytidylyltransferase